MSEVFFWGVDSQDGKLGVVLQQDGTNVVHVYGLRFLERVS